MSQLASYFGNRNATSTAVGFHARICNVALHSIHIYIGKVTSAFLGIKIHACILVYLNK